MGGRGGPQGGGARQTQCRGFDVCANHTQTGDGAPSGTRDQQPARAQTARPPWQARARERRRRRRTVQREEWEEGMPPESRKGAKLNVPVCFHFVNTCGLQGGRPACISASQGAAGLHAAPRTNLETHRFAAGNGSPPPHRSSCLEELRHEPAAHADHQDVVAAQVAQDLLTQRGHRQRPRRHRRPAARARQPLSLFSNNVSNQSHVKQ